MTNEHDYMIFNLYADTPQLTQQSRSKQNKTKSNFCSFYLYL